MTDKAQGAGFRRAMVYPLSSAHLSLPEPQAVAAKAAKTYLQMYCAKTFAPTYPDAVIVSHTGDDGLCGQIMLPPNEPALGELTTATKNLEIDALLQGINVVPEADDEYIGRGQQPQGFALMGFMFYRQAIDADPTSPTKGADRFVWLQVPKAKTLPMSGPYEEGGDDVQTYSLLPQMSKASLWGEEFTEVKHGFLQTQMLEGIAHGNPFLNCWTIEGTPDLLAYLFSEDVRADNAATGFDVTIYHLDMDGGAGGTPAVVDVTSQATITATQVDVDSVAPAPVADDVIYAWCKGLKLW